MLVGDLAVMIAQNRSGTVGNVRISEPGGQGWSFTQELVDATGGLGSGGVATALVARVFWTTFNGTWGANPSVTLTNADTTTALTVVMMVFRPTSGTKFWVGDVGPNYNNFAAPSSPFTETITGITTVAPSTVTIGLWAASAANTWGTLSGSGWSKTSLSAQYRNTSGSGQSLSLAYNIRTTAGAVANVSQNESAGTSGGVSILSLAETTLPTGGGTGSTGRIQFAATTLGSPGATSIATTFSTAIGSGHAVICSAHFETATPVYPTTASDDKSNSYVILSRVGNTLFGQDQIVFFSPNITNGPVTVTLNFSDLSTFRNIICHEVDNANAFDKFGGVDHALVDAFSTETISTIPALTPTMSNSYLFGTCHNPQSKETTPFITPAAGWTKVTERTDDNYATADRISSSSLQYTWTITLGRDQIGTIAVFSPFVAVAGNKSFSKISRLEKYD